MRFLPDTKAVPCVQGGCGKIDRQKGGGVDAERRGGGSLGEKNIEKELG